MRAFGLRDITVQANYSGFRISFQNFFFDSLRSQSELFYERGPDMKDKVSAQLGYANSDGKPYSLRTVPTFW